MTTESSTLALRLTPVTLLGGTARLLERNFLVYKHIWVVVLSGFFEPLFYLFAARLGIGGLVGDVELPNGEIVGYATFVAPALLAASAMNGALFESTMNVYFKLKFAKVYDAILSTPLKPINVALGEIGWSQVRGFIYAIGFLVVMVFGGLLPSIWGLLAVPAALLIGFAFGAVGIDCTTLMRSWQDFDMVTLGSLVLFLFSATFYPIEVYPDWLQMVAHFSPLYHGVTLTRSLVLGDVSWGLMWHVAILAAMCAVGLAVVSRRLVKLLQP
ncbi:MAG: ABC transporter permease [Actinomycetota bacterium]